MKPKFIGLLVAVGALVTSFTGRVQAVTLTWTNNNNSSWHSVANWSPNQMSGVADVAVLNRNVTVTLANDVSVTELQQVSGGTLNVATGALTTATLTWNDGWLRGTVRCGDGSNLGLLLLEVVTLNITSNLGKGSTGTVVTVRQSQIGS